MNKKGLLISLIGIFLIINNFLIGINTKERFTFILCCINAVLLCIFSIVLVMIRDIK